MAETHREYPGHTGREYPGHTGSPSAMAREGQGSTAGAGRPEKGPGSTGAPLCLQGSGQRGRGAPGPHREPTAAGRAALPEPVREGEPRLRRPSGVSRVSVVTGAGRSSALPLPKCPGRRGRTGRGCAGCPAAAAAAPRPVSGPAERHRHRRHRGTELDRVGPGLPLSAGWERWHGARRERGSR